MTAQTDQAEPKPDADVIAQLRILLDLAEAGSVVSLAYIAIGDGKTAPAVGFSGQERNALCAGVSMLEYEMMWKRI
jgi:hypothetical protein